MRYARQSKILEIIKNNEIDTQEKLVEKLNTAGYKATQATVSRDIKELGLVKTAGRNGRSCYAEAPVEKGRDFDRFSKILKETVLDLRAAENLIVIRTLSGCAAAAAEVLDNIGVDGVAGTIAGDNTIFMAVESKDRVDNVLKTLSELVGDTGVLR